MSSSNLVRIGYKKEAVYGVTPASVKAALVSGDITFTAVNGGEEGNQFSVEKLDTVAAGAEVATIQGKKISIAIESGVSTATQVMAALSAISAALATLGVSAAITGTAGNAQNAAAEAPLTGGSGSFKTARFTSEQYTGTPETTQSQQIRTDRQASGQVVTGLTVDGGHNFELAKEEALEDFIESAMCSEWVSTPEVLVALTLNNSTKKLTRVSGSFTGEGVVVGDFVQLEGFPTTANNVVVMVTAVSALEITYAGPKGMVSESGGDSYQVCDKITIGIEKKSLTIEKTFLDLTDKAIVYRGAIVSQMELNVEYGSLVTGSFQTSGNGYEPANVASEFASYQTSFSPPANTSSLNGSVDMPFIATNVSGSWEQDAFCLQNLSISLNNNLTVQNCIGKAAPENYSLGTAEVSADLSSYLKDTNWGLLARKLSQQPFAIGGLLQNFDGWYGFYIPALQVSFDDPQSGGQNQEVSMEMSGMAKVGANGEKALTFYRAPTV